MLLLARSGRERCLGIAAQRTAQHGLARREVQLPPPLGHLLLKFLVGQHHGLADVDHHVVDRSVAQSRPVSRIDDVLVGRRVVEVAGDTQNRPLRQQRRRILLVGIDPDPAVVVAGATQGLRRGAIDRIQAHSHAGGMHVRFEGDDLHVFGQRGERFDLLVGFERPDVEVQRRGDIEVLDLLLRLVALRMELEADLHRRFRVDA